MSLLDPKFVYHKAITHGDSAEFRERMKERAKAAAAARATYTFKPGPDGDVVTTVVVRAIDEIARKRFA